MRQAQKLLVISSLRYKRFAPATQKTFNTFLQRFKCQKVQLLVKWNDMTTYLEIFDREFHKISNFVPGKSEFFLRDSKFTSWKFIQGFY